MLFGLLGHHPMHQSYQRHHKQEHGPETDHDDVNRIEFGSVAF